METKRGQVESVEERASDSRERKKQRHTHSTHTLKNICVNLTEKKIRFLEHSEMILENKRERERDE